MSNNILILGATGAVGRQVINQAVKHVGIGRIYAPVRSLERFNQVLPKGIPDDWREKHLTVNVLEDFHNFESWLDKSNIDATTCSVVSCLGSTLAKAGSAEKFKAVDVSLALLLAKCCQIKGFGNYHVVSAAGASPSSSILYSKTKGELEDELKKLGFKNLYIYRPTLLLTDDGRHESRPLEAVGQTLARLTDWFGVWSVSTSDVARAILANCCQPPSEPGVHASSVRDMLKLSKSFKHELTSTHESSQKEPSDKEPSDKEPTTRQPSNKEPTSSS